MEIRIPTKNQLAQSFASLMGEEFTKQAQIFGVKKTPDDHGNDLLLLKFCSNLEH